MKINLLSTNGTKFSISLKTLATSLSTALGYKVRRTQVPNPYRDNLKYGQSVNKLYQYNWFKEQGLSALEFTTDKDQALTWINDGLTVFGRKYLNSSCGKGIEVFEDGEGWGIPICFSECKVFTKYKKKKREFRVHVFKDQVVSVTEKKRKKGWDNERDTKIRNLANGYVFCQQVSDEPEGLRQLALSAAMVSPSDFRGVDIGYNEKSNDLFVIEVNSAPGIQGSNLDKYTQTIINYVHN